MEVAQPTICNWFKNIKIDNPDQPSPKPDETEALKKQVELAFVLYPV
jgi:hypothetical protein